MLFVVNVGVFQILMKVEVKIYQRETIYNCQSKNECKYKNFVQKGDNESRRKK